MRFIILAVIFFLVGDGGDRQGGSERSGGVRVVLFYRICASITSLEWKMNYFFIIIGLFNNLSFTFGSDPTLVHYSLFCPHCRHVGVGVGGRAGEGGRVYGRIGFMWGGPLCGWWCAPWKLVLDFFFFRRQTLTISFPDNKTVYLFIFRLIYIGT